MSETGGIHKNPMGYLTFLSVLALLAPITRNYYILGFLGFLGFLPILKGRDIDERSDTNVNKASRNAFIYFVTVNSLFALYSSIFRDVSVMPLVMVVELLGSMTLFTASQIHYDRKGE